MADEQPPQDPFEMFRRLWGPLGAAAGHGDDLDRGRWRRIADLRSVQAWLT
jgi:hypothetical protein